MSDQSTSRQGTPPISCYIRTQNEQDLIERTVKSAFQIAREVVIVDSGSTDKTVEIAKAAGAIVIKQPWLGNGTQKRVGEDACGNTWLLDLDADEVVTPELAEEIRKIFSNGQPPLDVYSLRLVTAPPVGEPWNDFLIAYRNKLYDRSRVRMPDHKAWDQFQVTPELKVGKLQSALLHYSFRDFEHIVEKLNRVSTRRAMHGGAASIQSIRIRLLFGMPLYFLKAYIVKGRWRAGLYGYAMARISAYGRWLRDAKRYEQWRIDEERKSKHRT